MAPELKHFESSDGTTIACDVADTYQPDFARIATVRVATLMLVGGDSPRFLVEPTHRLHECILNSRMVVMPGQQHAAMNTAPDLFIKHVLEFLD